MVGSEASMKALIRAARESEERARRRDSESKQEAGAARLASRGEALDELLVVRHRNGGRDVELRSEQELVGLAGKLAAGAGAGTRTEAIG